ncbi:MAG: ABC transporter ATP-binding protein/permease, partial [Lachnospiraceae bacterium]|nr:ABC transporter ATP-binding protein/permease [Lachnospiraceae bacterium]
MDTLSSFLTHAYLLRVALNGISDGKPFEEILKVLLLWLFQQLGINQIWGLQRGWIARTGSLKVNKYIYNILYHKAASVELACYENPKYYDKFVKALDECEWRTGEVMGSFEGIVRSITGISTSLGLLITIDKNLLFFILIPLLTVPFETIRNKKNFERDMTVREENRKKEYARRTFYLQDYAKEMRLTGMPSLMLSHFKESGEKVINIIKKYGFSLTALTYIIFICNEILTTFGATLYAAYCTLAKGTMGYGDCIVVVNSIEGVAYTLSDSASRILRFQSSALYIENLRDFLDYEPKLVSGDIPLPNGGDLSLNNVSFKYDGANDYTLKNVNMHIGAKEKIAIVGHNGAGKTTLVKLLLRLYDPEGTITYDGTDIKEFDYTAYRDIFGAVMQDYHMFALTTAENVLLRRKKEGDNEDVVKALKMSGLYDKVSTYKDKENTLMTREFDENGEQLSGGQIQKLAISHVYLGSHKFVILDEPSSALDPIAEHEMYLKMTEVCKDCGMIFISHRLSSVVDSDRIYLMENGTVAECGTHEELMKKNGKYASMFIRQAKNYTEVEE